MLDSLSTYKHMTLSYIMLYSMYGSLHTICSIGNATISHNDLPIMMPSIAVAILPEEITCDGQIMSWETCGFFNNETTPTFYSFYVGIYRPNDSKVINYTVLQRHASKISANQSYTCFTQKTSSTFEVQAKDKIFVGIIQDCTDGKKKQNVHLTLS